MQLLHSLIPRQYFTVEISWSSTLVIHGYSTQYWQSIRLRFLCIYMFQPLGFVINIKHNYSVV